MISLSLALKISIRLFGYLLAVEKRLNSLTLQIPLHWYGPLINYQNFLNFFFNRLFNMIKSCFIKILSGLFPSLIPPIHVYILYKFWGKYARRVDKRYCSCSCWDTVFKGTYESGVASYKHMYFNATANTIKIWLATVCCILILYESLKHELKLLLKTQLRLSMGLLFLSSLFSHYYTWWVYINYWNDEFYGQWNHQMFFTLTEILSTGMVLYLSNTKTQVSDRSVIIIVSIALVHILAGGLDQFVKNILKHEGYAHQVLRDLSLVIPDFLHVIIPIIELFYFQKKNKELSTKNLRKNVLCLIILVSIGFFISITL